MKNLEALCAAWQEAKDREADARAERIRIEENILKVCPAKEEGSQSFETEHGIKVTVTGKLSYKADIDRLTALTGAWPDAIRPIRVKVEADDTRLKAIRATRPDLWAQIASAVETKPVKTGVEVKFKEPA